MTKRKQPKRTISSLEAAFVLLWAEVAAGTRLTTLEAEVRIKPRKFRYDFLIPGTNILIEVNGGTYSRIRMGHSSGEGQSRDYEKARYAQYKGYQIFTFDCKLNKQQVQELFEYVCRTYPQRI